MISDEYLKNIDLGVNIGMNAAIQSLIKLGVLVEMDGGIGYNGITIPTGVSEKILTDEIDDFIHSSLMDEFKDLVQDELSGMVEKELGFGG